MQTITLAELDIQHLIIHTVEDCLDIDTYGVRFVKDGYAVLNDNDQLIQVVCTFSTPIGSTLTHIITAIEDNDGIVPGAWSFVTRENREIRGICTGTFGECWEESCENVVLNLDKPELI